jgi:hypothetical protein
MGYCVTMDISGMEIPKSKAQEVLEKINDIPKIHGTNSFSWVQCPDGGFKTIKEAIEGWRFECHEHNDEIIIDYFVGEKWGDEEFFLRAIAPFIKDGVVECLGEDGERWRYLYEEGSVREQTGRTVWED